MVDDHYKLRIREFVSNHISIFRKICAGGGERSLMKQLIRASSSVPTFMEAVNRKASCLGMSSSYFTQPSGTGGTDFNYTTARDIAKLMIAASKCEKLSFIWSQKTKDIRVTGVLPRVEALQTTVQNALFEASYPILGGKTGSWITDTKTFNFAAISEIAGNTVVGVVMGAQSAENRFLAMKELFDIASNVLSDKSYDASSDAVSLSGCAIACVITGDTHEVLFEQNADERILPASVAKVLTAMTALDHLDDMKCRISILYSDIMDGSGNIFLPADSITFEDALYAMLLPSSNSAAQAVARTVNSMLCAD